MKKISLFLALLIFLPCSCASAMSYEEESKIANDFIAMLEQGNLIVHDEEIEWPIQMIADRLADHIKDPVYAFKLHAVKDRSVNAFTIPDGHIFMNLGTLLFARDMDEISAVVGHEMGHSQLRHIPEDFEAQKKLSAATLLGILAGTLLSTKNPEAGAGMIFSSLGGTQNVRLAYSREHEYAADNFGKDILTASGIDSSAMVRFLIRLRTFNSTSDMPEYLLTHPYTENRIVNMKEDPGQPKPDKNYWILNASVVGLMLSESEARTRASNIPEPYKSLALGLLQTRLGNTSQALDLLSNVDLPLACSYRGLNLYNMGRKDEAYPLLKDYPGTSRTKLALAEILMEKGQYNDAINVLVPFQNQSLRVDYTLGSLYEKTSKPALAHVSYARYFYHTGKFPSSSYHIDKALEAEKDLPADTVKELNSMKDMIKKAAKEPKQ